MSKIVLLVEGRADLHFVSMVRSITGTGLGDLTSRIRGGRPFWEATLFENDHDEQASRLRALADAAERGGVRLKVFELEPHEAFDACDWKQCKIDVETMRNILDEADHRRA